MDRSFLRRPIPDADRVLELLSEKQHLHPHASLHDVLNDASESAEICPAAIAQALTWLQLDDTRAIGRLRRTELTQLARSIHRHWQNNMNQNSQTPQVH